MSITLSPTSIVQIEIFFKTHVHRINLDFRVSKQINELCNTASLTISTLQKNEDIQHVIDWILWHRRLHNVDRVILYDNGSENRTELIENLKTLEPEVNIIFVDWQFPYGVFPYGFTQIGSIDHCRIRFSVKHGYCINLDIDEYLVKAGARNLLDYLQENLNYPFPGVCRIKECKVPKFTNSRSIGNSRIFDFHCRFKRFGHHPTKEDSRPYTKYIYKYDSPYYTENHDAQFNLHDFLYKNSILNRIAYRVKKILWKIKRHQLNFQNMTIERKKRTVQVRYCIHE